MGQVSGFAACRELLPTVRACVRVRVRVHACVRACMRAYRSAHMRTRMCALALCRFAYNELNQATDFWVPSSFTFPESKTFASVIPYAAAALLFFNARLP